jgi:hypothetical protein
MSYAYVREIDNPGQIPPSHYSAPIKESQVCTGWNPPIFFSLDSTTTTLGGSATLHLSFTNAIVLTAGLQFTLNYDNTAISAISATPGPSATNAGKTVSCADSTPPGAFTCLITGIPWNNMQDGVAANINVTVATLPTTIRLSALSGSLMGVNLPATIAIPGQVAPSSSGVISAAVALLDGCVCPGPDGSACWISTGYGSTGFWTPAASCAD